jgi:bacteriocin-like protein
MVTPDVPRGDSMKKKLTLSKETLRTLDEKELSLIVGGAKSGQQVPPFHECAASGHPDCR